MVWNAGVQHYGSSSFKQEGCDGEKTLAVTGSYVHSKQHAPVNKLMTKSNNCTLYNFMLSTSSTFL